MVAGELLVHVPEAAQLKNINDGAPMDLYLITRAGWRFQQSGTYQGAYQGKWDNKFVFGFQGDAVSSINVEVWHKNKMLGATDVDVSDCIFNGKKIDKWYSIKRGPGDYAGEVRVISSFGPGGQKDDNKKPPKPTYKVVEVQEKRQAHTNTISRSSSGSSNERDRLERKGSSERMDQRLERRTSAEKMAAPASREERDRQWWQEEETRLRTEYQQQIDWLKAQLDAAVALNEAQRAELEELWRLRTIHANGTQTYRGERRNDRPPRESPVASAGRSRR